MGANVNKIPHTSMEALQAAMGKAGDELSEEVVHPSVEQVQRCLQHVLANDGGHIKIM